MSDRIQQIIDQIKQLENDLNNELHQYEESILFRIKQARKVVGTYRLYRNFIAYGGDENYPKRLLILRKN